MPINIHDRVSEEVKALVRNGHLIKLDKCTTDHFNNPIVITAKKDGSINLAMDANAQIWKNNYQIPNIPELIDSAAQIITSNVPGSVWLTSLNLKYAFSQIKLTYTTSSQCNFSNCWGELTGTYRFNTGFYGLTEMPSEFQKAMDYPLQGIPGTICYLDGILAVSKGTLSKDNDIVHKIPSRFYEEGFAVKLTTCRMWWKLPHMITRLGRPKSHQKHTNFLNLIIPRQIKGQKVPIHIQDRVSEELKALARDGHNTNLDICTTNHFFKPIVITAKKENVSWLLIC